MKAEYYRDQVSRLLNMVERGYGDEAESSHKLPVAQFLDHELLERERQMFKKLPLIIGHSSQIKEAGDYFVKELEGRSWLVVRGKDGQARAFLNYCQHRGTKLVHDDKGECKARFVCPYHAWTYNNQGELIGVPRADLFDDLDKKELGLAGGKLEEAHGFLWLNQEGAGEPIANYLGELNKDLATMGLDSYHLYFDETREINTNWKFPIFAFLEAYHLSSLHKDSIAEFFFENIAHSELLGRHIRSFVPRKNFPELAQADLNEINISEYATPTNILFPNICMIEHPTSMSVIAMFPGTTPGTSSWRHMLLTPEIPTTAAQRGHYDKTIAVLDGMTYEKEDFWVSEQSQEGINAGAIEYFTLSKNEYMIKVFNDLVKQHLSDLSL